MSREFTGYHDAEGTPICQGDIVEAMDNYSDHAGPVPVMWVERDQEWAAGKEWFLSTFCKMNEVRVIGDIYNDSDLLRD